MKKKSTAVILTLALIINLCSCGIINKPVDKKTGFSDFLKQTEMNIRKENWTDAKSSISEAEKVWKKVKPILQIDIDHDYINNIEEDFIKLNAYIDTKEKPNSLATIMLIKDTWENIGSL